MCILYALLYPSALPLAYACIPFLTQIFDAVVVASGRWNAPNIPNITGLKELNSKFPERILHARQYRYPHAFKNETILIVGAAVSHLPIVWLSFAMDSVTFFSNF